MATVSKNLIICWIDRPRKRQNIEHTPHLWLHQRVRKLLKDVMTAESGVLHLQMVIMTKIHSVLHYKLMTMLYRTG